MIPWESQVDTSLVRPRGDSVLTHINSIAKANGGGTNMSSPVQYMIKNKIRCDVFVGITDSEEWSGRGWLDSWVEYRKKVNKNAKAVLIRVDSYSTQPFPDDKAEEYGIYQVYGFNDSVLSFIENVVL